MPYSKSSKRVSGRSKNQIDSIIERFLISTFPENLKKPKKLDVDFLMDYWMLEKYNVHIEQVPDRNFIYEEAGYDPIEKKN